MTRFLGLSAVSASALLASIFLLVSPLPSAAGGAHDEDSDLSCPGEADQLVAGVAQRADCLLQQGSLSKKLPLASFIEEDVYVSSDKQASAEGEGSSHEHWQDHLNEPAAFEDAAPLDWKTAARRAPSRTSPSNSSDAEEAAGFSSNLQSILMSALSALGQHPPNLGLLQQTQRTSKRVRIVLAKTVDELVKSMHESWPSFLARLKDTICEVMDIKPYQIKIVKAYDDRLKYHIPERDVNAQWALMAEGEAHPAADFNGSIAHAPPKNGSTEVWHHGHLAEPWQSKEQGMSDKPTADERNRTTHVMNGSHQERARERDHERKGGPRNSSSAEGPVWKDHFAVEFEVFDGAEGDLTAAQIIVRLDKLLNDLQSPLQQYFPLGGVLQGAKLEEVDESGTRGLALSHGLALFLLGAAASLDCFVGRM